MKPDCTRFAEALALESPSPEDTAFVRAHGASCDECASFQAALGTLGPAPSLDEVSARAVVNATVAAFAQRSRQEAFRRRVGWGAVALAAAGLAVALVRPGAPAQQVTPKPPRLATQTMPQDAALPQEDIQTVLADAHTALTRCVEKGVSHLEQLSAAQQTIRLSFTILPSGAVSHAAIKPPTEATTEMGKCLLGLVGQLSFPASEGETEVELPVGIQIEESDGGTDL